MLLWRLEGIIVLERYIKWTPGAIIYVQLEVCMAAQGLMCNTFENLFEIGWLFFIHILKLTWTLTSNIRWIMKISRMTPTRCFSSPEDNRIADCLYTSVSRRLSADDDRALQAMGARHGACSFWRVLGKQVSVSGTMWIYDFALRKNF